MAKSLWQQADEFREDILALNLNEEDAFKEIGDFRFYSDGGYVSIDERVGDSWRSVLALHSTGSFGKTLHVFTRTCGSREEALKQLNEEWDKIDKMPSLFRRINKTLGVHKQEQKAREEARKQRQIQRLKDELEKLEGGTDES